MPNKDPLHASLHNALRQKQWSASPIVSATTGLMKTFITFSALILFLVTAPLLCAMEIRQELYTFSVEPARSMPRETYVIAGASLQLAPSPVTCQIASVRFEKNSSELSPENGEIILSALRKCEIDSDIPLTITGYTCTLGPDQFNQGLSLARARTVANFLQKSGYNARWIQGLGSQKMMSQAPHELYMNRRVEITIAP